MTPEASGGSQIEIAVALGGGYDHVDVALTGRKELLAFKSDGIDVGNDPDRDILTAGVEYILVDALGGNDRIDASAYISLPPGTSVGVIELRGGRGHDVLIGSPVLVNHLYREEAPTRCTAATATT